MYIYILYIINYTYSIYMHVYKHNSSHIRSVNLLMHRYMMRKQVSVIHLLLVVLYCYRILAKPISYRINSTHNWSINFKMYVGDQVRIEFMPGVYEVQEDTVISNINNFSITGDSYSASHVTFSCSNSSWIIANSSFIEINNIRFLNCGKRYDAQLFEGAEIKATMFMHNVYSIRMVNVTIGNSCGYGIIALNIVGVCTFQHIIIHCNNTLGTFCDNDRTILGGMAIKVHGIEAIQQDTVINIKECLFFNIQAIQDDETIINTIGYFNSSVISIFLYQVNFHIDVNIERINITNVTIAKGSIISLSYSTNSTSNVTITNSLITYTNANYSTVKINYIEANTTLLKLSHTFCLAYCNFYCNKALYVFRMRHIYSNNMIMQLKNNIFENNTVKKTLFRTKEVVPVISGYSNFSSNKASIVFAVTYYVLMNEGSVMYFINNSVNDQNIVKYKCLVKKDDIGSPHCPFQFNNSTNVSIIFHGNTGYYRNVYGNAMFGCTWIPSFPNREMLLPNEIYNKIIHHGGVKIKGISGWENSVCPCNGKSRYDQNCLSVKSFRVYPGETISIRFRHFYFDIAMFTDLNDATFNTIAPACGVYPKNSTNPIVNLVFKQCTLTKYTITSNSSQCLLLLKTATKEKTVYAFRVKLNNCSQGFILDHKDGICKCNPKLVSSLNGLECDISKKAFQRPPRSWIGNDGDDIIFTKDCRLNYCLQYTSLVKLSKPDTQCLSGRSGIACGECAQGLSVVFGTSQCKKCTNHWLLLIPVFAIAGLLLVVTLFVFNLTVVDGDIYGYILMISALSLHSGNIIPSTMNAPWVLVALSNLDLGIEVCFYNGMTAYSATWLCFMFPIYVLLIVVAMAFASRYFQIIEKITRKRVIPVIATLYLLSYGKIMQITFRVLFSYTTVYHLRSENKKLYLTMDSSIEVFGVQFLFLFIFCSVVFVFVIIPTNILLISGKTIYRFKVVVKYLKPFLDAYEAPFKENCRYILGVELLLRAVIFAITSLSGANIVAVYSGVLLVYIAYVCQVMPFKSRFNSIIYTLYLIYMSAYIILYTRFYPLTSKTYEVMFNTVFYLSFIQFLGIIIIHVWKYNLRHYTLFATCEKFIKKKNSQLNAYVSRNSCHISMDSVRLSTSGYENFQEELLALDTDV